jgi:hypothetical protein
MGLIVESSVPEDPRYIASGTIAIRAESPGQVLFCIAE